ncbi:zinc finger protein 1 [Biomphalaria glabrata]|nr:zinc finger protein 1 [Biomphalaria glabrata]
MMSDTKHDFTFDLNHVLKYVKKEVEETDLLTQPCEEQDFKVSMIKIEKADGDNSELHSQQSENFAENFGDLKNTLKQEEEMTHFTDMDKSLSLASRLLAMSEKANNSHCVPIIMPKYETLRDLPVPEVSLSQSQFIEEDDEITSENYELAENMQDQLEEYHHSEQVLRKEIDFQKSFQCQICLKEFSQFSHLKNHQLTHTGLQNIKMLICQRGFSTSSELKRHKLGDIGEENDNLTKVQFREEEKEMTLRKSVMTDNMQDQFSSLKTHQMIHTDEKKFKCQTCQKRFWRKANLKCHQRIHTSKKSLKFHIWQPKNFENHLLRHTLKKNTFKCQICLKEYSASSSLKSHQMIHTDDNKFKCQNCQKSELKSHKMIHTDEKTFKCHICQREFSCSTYLKAHLRRHTATCEKAFECQICLCEFSYSRTLKSHMLRHTGTCEGTFKCLICRSEFSQFSSLKTHQMIHTDEKKLKCQTCQKPFWRKADLKRHQMIHTGEKTFKCRICPKKFSSASYLKIHHLIHTDCPVA